MTPTAFFIASIPANPQPAMHQNQEKYGLKPRGCIHVSSALIAGKTGAMDFVSYDSDFDIKWAQKGDARFCNR